MSRSGSGAITLTPGERAQRTGIEVVEVLVRDEAAVDARAERVDRRRREGARLVLAEEGVDQDARVAVLEEEPGLPEPGEQRGHGRNLAIASATPSSIGRDTGPPTSSMNDVASTDGGNGSGS